MRWGPLAGVLADALAEVPRVLEAFGQGVRRAEDPRGSTVSARPALRGSGVHDRSVDGTAGDDQDTPGEADFAVTALGAVDGIDARIVGLVTGTFQSL